MFEWKTKTIRCRKAIIRRGIAALKLENESF